MKRFQHNFNKQQFDTAINTFHEFCKHSNRLNRVITKRPISMENRSFHPFPWHFSLSSKMFGKWFHLHQRRQRFYLQTFIFDWSCIKNELKISFWILSQRNSVALWPLSMWRHLLLFFISRSIHELRRHSNNDRYNDNKTHSFPECQNLDEWNHNIFWLFCVRTSVVFVLKEM